SRRPRPAAAGRGKPTPPQHSVRRGGKTGVLPALLAGGTARDTPAEIRQKIAMFCNVDPGSVFFSPDVRSIYELPLELHRQGLDERLSEGLNIWSRAPQLGRWEKIRDAGGTPAKGGGRIGVGGEDTDLQESYKSLNEALMHGGIANEVKVTLKYVDSQDVEAQGPAALLGDVQAVLVPGGFGVRGTEGKVAAVRYARERKIPFFGICLGLQMAVVEFARNVLGLQ